MFAEKKLIILKNVFEAKKFQEDFLEVVKNIEEYNETVLHLVDKNKNIILSGNIDSCNFKYFRIYIFH